MVSTFDSLAMANFAAADSSDDNLLNELGVTSETANDLVDDDIVALFAF